MEEKCAFRISDKGLIAKIYKKSHNARAKYPNLRLINGQKT